MAFVILSRKKNIWPCYIIWIQKNIYTVTPGFPKASIQVHDMQLSVLRSCYIDDLQTCFSQVSFMNKLSDLIYQNVAIRSGFMFGVHVFVLLFSITKKYWFAYSFLITPVKRKADGSLDISTSISTPTILIMLRMAQSKARAHSIVTSDSDISSDI